MKFRSTLHELIDILLCSTAANVPQNEELVVASSLNVKSKEKVPREKRQFGGLVELVS